MPRGITGSGGVDTSSLDAVVSKLEEILQTQSEINEKRVAPKGDDSNLIPVRKSLETIREEIEKTNSKDIDFLNSKTIKKSVNEAITELEKIKKSTNNFEDDMKNMSIAENFIKNFKLLDEYSKRLGKDLVKEYRQIFKDISEEGLYIDLGLSSVDNGKVDELYNELIEKIHKAIEKASNSAKNTVDIELNYAVEDYYDDLAKQAKTAYDQERQAAIESAEATKRAESEKRQALRNTRDEILKETKALLNDINDSTKENEFLDIDLSKWGEFQKHVGNMIQSLSEMGVETRELDDLLDSINKKIYVPKEQINAARKGVNIGGASGAGADINELNEARKKVQELHDKIIRLQNVLDNRPSGEFVGAFERELEEAKSYIETLENEVKELRSELNTSASYDEWTSLTDQIEKYEEKVHSLIEQLHEYHDENEKLTKKGGNLNSDELSSFLSILEKIEEQLRSISNTLGTVDDTSGFNNMISSIDTLLSKLEEMHKKIGTGVYNIQLNQGIDKSSHEQDENVKSYLRDTKNRYSNAYNKIVEKAGGEELLFAHIFNATGTSIDELKQAYSSINVSQIGSQEQQIYRLIDFFKILKRAASEVEFGLDLKGIRLPSDSDENFRKTLRDKSGETERRKQQRAKESILSDEPEESLPGLNKIQEALERIESLITEISKKDLFGDSLTKVSEQLNSIIEKFNTLAVEVKVANADLSSIGKVTKITSQSSVSENVPSSFESAITEYVAELDRLQDKSQKAQQSIKEVIKASAENDNAGNALETISNELNKLNETAYASPNEIKASQEEYRKYLELREKALAEGRNQAKQVDIQSNINSGEYSKQVDEVANKFKSWGATTETINEKLAEVRKSLKELNSAPIEKQIEAEKQFNVALKEANAEQKKYRSEMANSKNVAKWYKSIANWTNQNSAATKKYGAELKGMMNSLQNATSMSRTELDGIVKQFLRIQAEANRTGATGKSFFDQLSSRARSLAQYLMTYVGFQDVIRVFREGIGVVREFDTALTEMRKVSDESLSTLKNYAATTFDIGDSVGATALTIQKSTADWQRLGESLEEAKESAKDANILLNVSEFDSIDAATESLVSMSQAYKELDKMEIIDVMNRIGNEYSISTDQLSMALQDSAAVLQSQGNDLYKAVSLITAGNAIGQDYSKTAGGVRTISLRIAGTEEAKQELSELGEEVDDFIVQTQSKTQKVIKDYTAVASNAYKGIDVLDANGNLRDTYDILLDIAKVYKEIQEEDKTAGTNRAQALVEYIAGKNRSNIAASILQNPEMLEDVYKSALESQGSAQEELDKYLDSVDGKVTQVTNHLQELATTTINSDDLKTVLDIFNDLLPLVSQFVDKVGLLGIAGLGTGAILGAKDIGRSKMFDLIFSNV